MTIWDATSKQLRNPTSSSCLDTSAPDFSYMAAYIKAQQKLAMQDTANDYEKSRGVSFAKQNY